jgi:hypothetical protein
MKFYWCLPLVLLSACPAVAADVPRMLYRIETVAGSANIGDGGAAVLAQIGNIQGVAVDRWGNLYLSDTDNHRVRKVSAGGVISTLVGTGFAGFSGDGGPAAGAQLNLPYGLAVDLAGCVYIADLGNQRVRRVGPDGTITTIAGTGFKAASGDGGPAVQASLMTPRNVAVDAAGNLYFSEFEGHRIRKVTPDGRIFTVAGTGLAGFRGDGGAATSAQIGFPAGLAVDRSGVLYFADSQNQRVRRILPGGTISTVLGGDAGTALLTPWPSRWTRAAACTWQIRAAPCAPGPRRERGPRLRAPELRVLLVTAARQRARPSPHRATWRRTSPATCISPTVCGSARWMDAGSSRPWRAMVTFTSWETGSPAPRRS